ncbi:MAG: AarF/UbiB family protein [Microthrixaceae bacterium]
MKAFTGGPFIDGPNPLSLRTISPELNKFGISELRRVIRVGLLCTFFVLRALPRRFTTPSTSFSEAAADGLIDAFMRLGPTFVKLGQIIASSPGIFPAWLTKPARRCLDEVPAFSAEIVRLTVAEDLGRPIHELFASFEDQPLSAASIGQVHACTLLDGREAVVKVQRPNLRQQMTTDLRVLHSIAQIGQRTTWGQSANLLGMVADLSALTAKELNPVLEAWNQQRFRDKIWAFGDNSWITAPEVFWDYCGPRTICMERVHGIPMDQFEEIAIRGVDGELLLRRGAKVWVEAMLMHGPFHGDMHAGNIWLLQDGRACFLDFGIMGELDEQWRQVVRDLYFTCVFDRDFVRVAQAYLRVGVFPPDMGTEEEIGESIGNVLSPLLDAGLASVSLGDLITSSVGLMKEFGGTPPQELMLVGKQLLYIERYTKELAPDYSMITDPFLLSNVFPEAAEKLRVETGTVFPD